MLKSFVAGVGIFLAGLFGTHQASAPPLPSAPTVSMAAAAATAFASSDPQQSTTSLSTSVPAPAQTAPAVSTPSAPDLSAYVTKAELNARLSGLSAFSNSLQKLVYQFSNIAPVSTFGPFAPLTVAAFAPSQRIDNLANVTISNATVNGISGLTASNIPDLSGSYLSLSGGTVTGNLNVTGTITGNASTTNFFSTNASTTNSTSTNSYSSTTLFSTLSHFTTGIIDSLTTTAATVTNLIVTTIIGTNATFTNATTTNATTTNIAVIGNTVLATTTINGPLTLNNSLTTGPLTFEPDSGAVSWIDLPITAASAPGAVESYTASLNTNPLLTIYGVADGTGTTTSLAVAIGTTTPGFQVLGGTNADTFYVAGNSFLDGNQITFGSSTAPTGTPLTIKLGRASTTTIPTVPNAFSIASASSGVTPWFTIDGTTGNVGIGSTSPATKLSVAGSGYLSGNLSVSGNIASGTHTITGNFVGFDNNLAEDDLVVQARYGASSNSAGGHFGLRIQDPNTPNKAAGLYAVSEASYANQMGLAIYGYTGGLYSEKVRIAGNGNVGIGTTNPGSKLEVQGLASAQYFNATSSTNYSTFNGGFLSQASSTITSGLFSMSGGASTTNITASGTGYFGNAAFTSSSGTTTIASGQGFTIGGTQFVVQQGSGNVGIGTAAPDARLAISGGHVAIGNNYFYESHNNSGSLMNMLGMDSNNVTKLIAGSNGFNLQASDQSTSRLIVSSSGNVGIGTTTPYARLTVWGPDTASTSAFVVANSASTTEFAVYDTGNAVLAGTLTQSSDQRLKTNIQSLDASSSLAAIDALNPVTFNWIDPNKGSEQQLGFIAQQVLPIFPNLVSTTSATALTPNGTLSLNYIDLVAPIVKAIQVLNQRLTNLANAVGDLADKLTTKELVATNVTADTVTAHSVKSDEFCVGSICVTEAQFKAMVAAANQSPASANVSSAGSSATTTPDSTLPVISVNGDNPAHIHVGDAYNDLGATITGPQSDLNLGIRTFLNGALVSNIVLDTSAVATDTIDYVVMDKAGITSTSTRTVVITLTGSTTTSQ
jgi:hypothetical protein